MSTEKSIGVFDSGLGGLTVLAALRKKFPHESMVYLGDTARLPYGTKSPETVIKYALNCAKALMQKADLKLLVIACNTATAHALKTLQECLPIPVIGVIEPGVLEVLAHPEIKSVAVLATPGTILVGAYEKALRKHGFLGAINSQACPLFVPLVEEGLVSGPIAESIAKYYLERLPAKPDAVILGCTHYPLLLPVLRNLLPKETIWIDSGSETAKQLKVKEEEKKESVRYFVTDAPESFKKTATLFLGAPVLDAQVELIDVGTLS